MSRNYPAFLQKIPVICVICVKFSIKNAATYQQKSENSNFFNCFSNNNLILSILSKNKQFSHQMRNLL
jgi:hypothetical protein